MQSSTWKQVLVGACVVAGLTTTAASPAGANVAAPAPALSILVVAPLPEAQARFSTTAGVVRGVSVPRMAIGVYVIGVRFGAELVYGRAPAVGCSEAPAKPREPSDPTQLIRKLYDLQLKEWKRQLAAWRSNCQSQRDATVLRWVNRQIGGLVNSTIHSPSTLTASDVAVALLRSEQFYIHERGLPLLLIIGNLPDRPPAAIDLPFSMAGVRVVLAGWTPDEPSKFQRKVNRWRSFFLNKKAAGVTLVVRGLDSTDNLVRALKADMKSATR